jgi:hypothetical protein
VHRADYDVHGNAGGRIDRIELVSMNSDELVI